ncbi:hypothetical protein ICM05_02640 [Leucobacter sp. cx-42]|uniref:hypothetical protein n=1 Tax=unclassified Leucobacter TaxID=2621730 RepID=UPI00165EA01F|nr:MULTISPECIES: hypothetical protein [unclassified Leucobacter]MBC9953548.1 hypothetical protein [Leucobacter sp. cx-42]
MSTAIGPNAFVSYVMTLLAISALTVFLMPETKGRILTDDHKDFTKESSLRHARIRSSHSKLRIRAFFQHPIR